MHLDFSFGHRQIDGNTLSAPAPARRFSVRHGYRIAQILGICKSGNSQNRRLEGSEGGRGVTAVAYGVISLSRRWATACPDFDHLRFAGHPGVSKCGRRPGSSLEAN